MSKSVKFGLRIPAFPLNDSRGSTFRDEIIDFLAALEGQFDSVWVADHFVPWHTETDIMTDTLEAWTGLTFLAGKFESYDFGTIVLSQSYRNPALLAKMAATFQLMSGGRLILAIGAGWKEDEYLAYGYELPIHSHPHPPDGRGCPDHQADVDRAKSYFPRQVLPYRRCHLPTQA